MRRLMMKSKLHRVHVTQVELDYEGSVAIDARLLDAADIREYERIEVYNLRNGERFNTYAIRGEYGSGMISVNGAAAHKAAVGDSVIICTYAEFEERELLGFKPRLVYVDGQNRITHTRRAIPVQVA